MGETTQCRMSKIRAEDMRVAVMMGVEDVADSTSPMAESRRRQRGCRARGKRKRKRLNCYRIYLLHVRRLCFLQEGIFVYTRKLYWLRRERNLKIGTWKNLFQM